MEILPANLLDINALRHLEKECFPQDAWPILDLVGVLSFSGVVRLKAVENGQMIGFVAGDPRPTEGISWIATICILPEYRGRGYGRALLEACENLLPTEIIHLCVRFSNEEAIRMYHNAGYQNVDRWENYYNDGEDSLVMEKLKGIGTKSAL
ncbi:MAG TPA: GNAT family N-acetyltransferase [Anaerolineales bacterium]|jgi:ribosomal-protein-alanine N-acetyltransferase